MWKKAFAYLAIWCISFLLGHYCGHLVNSAFDVSGYDFALGIFFCAASILGVCCGINLRDKKILENLYRNQIKVQKSKKFSLYRCYDDIKTIVFGGLLFLVSCCIYIGFFEFMKEENRIIYLIYSLCGTLIIWLLIFKCSPHIHFGKGGILFFEKYLAPVFNIVEKNTKFKEDASKEFESVDNMIWHGNYKSILLKETNSRYEYLKTYYENFPVCLGIAENKKCNRHSRISRRRWVLESNIFITFELPYKFKHKTYIGLPMNFSRIEDSTKLEEQMIIPIYNNVKNIFYENKEYSSKILSATVQKKISDLNIEIKNVQLGFDSNKIIAIIPNSRWSTPFSRIFNKEKNAQNILNVIETVLTYLKEISYELEKYELYQ